MQNDQNLCTAWTPRLLGLLRVVAGLLFMQHGAMKLLGVMGGGQLPPLMWLALVLELVGGALIVLGLFTRPVAFVLSGEMAFAYFMAHAPQGFLPIKNGGEGAVLYCFIFLFLAAAGSGVFALDNLRSKNK
ncbi:MAG: DoxX family protein [Herbaspirillum sp.]